MPSLKTRLFGIPVEIQPIFFLLLLFGAAGRTSRPALFIEWVVSGTFSILLHEMGHAFAFQKFGRQPAIALHGMGGVTWSTDGKGLTPRQNIVVSFCGPAVGFLIAGVVLFLSQLEVSALSTQFARVTFHDLIWINFGWGVINCLPVLPLDGGHILESLLLQFWPARGNFLAHLMSLLFAAFIGVTVFVLGDRWGSFLALWCCAINARVVMDLKKNQKSASFFSPILSLVEKNDADGAWALLKEIRPSQVPDRILILVESSLFRAGRFEEALQLCEVLFEREGNALAAYRAACSSARLGRGPHAVEWLRRAVTSGYSNIESLKNDPEFESLHALREWKDLGV